MSPTQLDRILEVAPETARGLRHVPVSLDVFDTHFPRFPVLPGVLLLGGLFELAAALLEKRLGGTWTAAGAERVRFLHVVQPGDTVLFGVSLLELAPESALLEGAVDVDGRRVATVARLALNGARPAPPAP